MIGLLVTIELLSKNNCVQCNATVRSLNKANATYSKFDMSQDVEYLDIALGLGYNQAPVVLIKDSEGNITDSWSGFNPEKIAEYV